jgi:capsular polysaccharide biosynthesis protein
VSSDGGMTFDSIRRSIGASRWLLGSLVVLGSALGLAASVVKGTDYTSSESMYLTPAQSFHSYFSPLLLKTYAAASADTSVLSHTAAPLPTYLDSQLRTNPTAVTVPPNANLVVFTLSGGSPHSASDAVTRVASSFEAFVRRSSAQTVRVIPISGGASSPVPISWSKDYIVIGAFLGLALGVYLSVRRYRDGSTVLIRHELG